MIKQLQKVFLSICFIAGLGNVAQADDLVIAGNSGGAASIVIGLNATETEKYAAEEFQRCIKIMSGVDLSIVTSGTSVSGTQVIIGSPAGNSKINEVVNKLQLDGTNEERIAVLREGNILYLAGQTARASLYATYTFLGDILGVRWLWPGDSGEFIPRRTVVSVGALSLFEVPSIKTRSLAIVNVTNSYPETDTWQARNRMNLISIPAGSNPTTPVIANRLKKGFQTRIAGHNIVLPASVLTAHPEYAALSNGSRAYTDAKSVQLCWGNPNVQQEVANMLASWWNQTPYIDVIHFYPADNQSYCQDDLCRNLASDVSTRWQKFSQIVMEKVDQTHPGKKYWTYAYQGYKRTPQTVASRFESIGYTHYEVSYRHLISSGYAPNAGSIAEINGWLSKGANLGIRGYEYIMFREPMFVPLVSWEVDQMAWMASKGLNAYLSETRPYDSPRNLAPENTYWTCNRMNLYAAAKAMWNTSVTADSLVKDWCKTIYGPAADAMIAYYWDIEQAWRNAPGNIQEYNNTPASEADNFLSPAAFVRLNGYFTQARTKLAEITDIALRNRIAEQIDLESRMLANWQNVYNLKKNRSDHFETNIAKVDTLNEASWNGAAKLPAFENASGEAVEEQTIVAKAWTASDLNFRIVCQDNNIASRVKNATTDDGNITADDCIEIFIQPDPAKPAYMHFAVNTLGKKYDAISAYGGTGLDITWNPAWTTAVAVGADTWSVDVKIPFASLGISAQDSSKFKITIKRSRAGRAENSGWPDASYFNPGSFGLATLVAEIPKVANKILLYDNGSVAGADVSVEFQQRGWQVIPGVTGEQQLKEKLNDNDINVLLFRYTSTAALISNATYLNEVKNFIEKGNVVMISAARNMPIEQWFPGTPGITWSGDNKQAGNPRNSTYQLPGAWQTYPNNLSAALKNNPAPVTAYTPKAEGWTLLAKMRMKDGTDQPFLMSRRVGDGLLVLTSSPMGYSGGYDVFGSRNITNAVKLVENFVAQQEAFPVTKKDQTITMDSIPAKVFGEPDFTITATSSSGLPVTFTSSDESVALVTNGIVQLTGIGTTTITASQSGNSIYNAAADVNKVLLVVADTIAPSTPPDLSATATDSTVTLTWGSSTDFIGVTAYQIYKGEELLDTTSHNAIKVNGLSSSIQYTFKIIAVDAAGNQSQAAIISVTTPDTQAPNIPQTLTANKTNKHKVELNWQQSTDNVSVAGYHIYRNGTQLSTSLVSCTTYLAERPRGKDVYEFRVKAIDAAGNISPASNSVISANGNIKDMISAFVEDILDGEYETIITYPNPSHGSFKLKVSTNENGLITISVFNSSGALVRSIKDLKNGPYLKDVNVQNLPAGTYVVRVAVSNFSEAKTIIIN